MQQGNRLEREMKQWEAREQRFAKLFSSSILQSRAFKKEKIRHLRKISSQYRWSDDLEERMTRKLLNQERRLLENELYPNRLKRNFFRFVGSLGRLANAIIKPSAGKVELGKATADLKRAGFSDMKENLRQHNGKVQDKFSITDVRKVNKGEQLEYRPEFRKGPDGQLHYDGHSVTLSGEGKPVSYRMDAGDMRLGEQRAYNLLSGRSVLVKGQWLSLDANDKDASGNLRIKKLSEQKSPDIPAELAKLPIKENRLATAREELVKGLKNGDRVSVTVKLNGKESNYYVTAGDKGLNLSDKSGKKVTLQEITGQAKKVGRGAGQSNTNALKTDKKVTPQNNVKTIKLNKGARISR